MQRAARGKPIANMGPPKRARTEEKNCQGAGGAATAQEASKPIGGAPSAASGATAAEAPPPSSVAAAGPAPVSITSLLEMDSLRRQDEYVTKWASETKTYVDQELLKFFGERPQQIGFLVPSSVMLIAPLEISAAASGAFLSSFREVMNYDNLVKSFSQSAQYEAAGTVFMLDAVSGSPADVVTISQLESATRTWSEEAFLLSSNHLPSRRYSFDVPLPAMVVDVKVAQRKDEGKPAAVMAQPLLLLAGRALVLTWYAEMAQALQSGREDRVTKLFEAALSVPIRMRLCPDEDSCRLASLHFSENLFGSSAASGADAFWKFVEKVGQLKDVSRAIADNASIPKLTTVLKCSV